MNRAGASRFLPSIPTRQSVEADVDRVYGTWLKGQWEEHVASSALSLDDQRAQVVFGRKDDERTMGYVTKDACPGVGDDIEHVPGEYYPLTLFRPFSSPALPISPHQSQKSWKEARLTELVPHYGYQP